MRVKELEKCPSEVAKSLVPGRGLWLACGRLGHAVAQVELGIQLELSVLIRPEIEIAFLEASFHMNGFIHSVPPNILYIYII